MSQQLLHPWQNDWQEFTKLLQAKILSRESQTQLSSFFGGVEICWTGTIERFDFDTNARLVVVSLPPQSVIVGNGSEVLLDNLALAVSAECEQNWQEVKIGDKVTFVATLHEKNAIFPPIEIASLGTGKKVILINANNSRPARFRGKSSAADNNSP